MYYVYILKDDNSSIYIGYTNNIERRFSEHQSGKCFTTRKLNNPQVYYIEGYTNEEDARTRERKLKQFGSSYVGLMKRIGLK
jgi:putative endonuclease